MASIIRHRYWGTPSLRPVSDIAIAIQEWHMFRLGQLEHNDEVRSAAVLALICSHAWGKLL